jgi:hypothetical protein
MTLCALRSAAARLACEFVLVVVCAAALSTVVLQGFECDPALQFNPLLVGGSCAVLVLPLYMAAEGGRRGFAAGLAAFFALYVLAVALGALTSAGEDLLADVPQNHLAFAFTVATCAGAVFALTRRAWGRLALTAAGLFACAFVQYVYAADLYAPTFVFCGALAALWVVRTFAQGARAARGAAQDLPAPRAYLAAGLTGVAVALLALGFSAAVYVCVVAPLSPGRVEVKLFTEYRSFETVEVSNPASVERVEDPDQVTTALTDEVVYGNNPVQLDATDPALADVGDFVEQSREVSGSKSVFKLELVDEGGVYLYTYDVPSWWWLALCALPFVLVGLAVALRKALRARRRRQMRAQGPREQVGLLYTRLVRNLGVLGRGPAPSATPAEFAREAAERLAAFEQPADPRTGAPSVTWRDVWEVYERSHYGEHVPTPDELALCWRMYDGFFGRARVLVGRVRYCCRYFWLL